MTSTDLPDDDLDEVLDKIEGQLKSDIDEYKNFQLWCDEAIESWDQRNKTEKESFRQVLSEFEYLRDEKIAPNKINNIRNRLTEAYREPIAETVRELIRTISTNLDLDLSSEQIDGYIEIIRNRSNREIESIREDYQEAQQIISDSQETIKKYLHNEVSNDDTLLLNPKKKFLPKIEEATKSFDNLSSITADISSYEWSPDDLTPLEEDVENYPFYKTDLTQYTKELESIDNSYGEIKRNSLDISHIISSEIYRIIGGNVANLLENLEELHERLKHIEESSYYYDIASNVSQTPSDRIPDPDGMMEEGPSQFIDDDETMAELCESLDNFEQKYNTWENQFERRWRDLVAIIDTYNNQFGYDVPESLSIDIDILEILQENPDRAIREFQDAQEWVDSRGSELSDQLDSHAVRLMNDLIQEGDVRAEDYEIEAIAELHQKVPLLLSIDE